VILAVPGELRRTGLASGQAAARWCADRSSTRYGTCSCHGSACSRFARSSFSRSNRRHDRAGVRSASAMSCVFSAARWPRFARTWYSRMLYAARAVPQ
jgi:hypothetical protein